MELLSKEQIERHLNRLLAEESSSYDSLQI